MYLAELPGRRAAMLRDFNRANGRRYVNVYEIPEHNCRFTTEHWLQEDALADIDQRQDWADYVHTVVADPMWFDPARQWVGDLRDEGDE